LIWKGINQIIYQQQFLRVISLLWIVFTLILVVKYSKSNPEKALFPALAFPVFNSYVHLYDYVEILLMAIKYVTLKRFESSILILPFLFFFPISKNLFLLSMTVELVLIRTIIFRLKSRSLVRVGLGLVASQIIAYPLILNSNQEIQMPFYLSRLTVSNLILFMEVYIGE
jgi:hypothetical protein